MLLEAHLSDVSSAMLPSFKDCSIHADARVLIVDDSATMRRLIAWHLKSVGLTNLDFAEDGIAALAAAEAVPPDLVIADLAMPNMDGFELCRRLRADPRTADVPILIQTGSDEKEDRARSFEVGASDLIAKPIESREMIARVRVHLERRSLINHLQEYQRRMETELTLARSMQHSLLPHPDTIAALKRDLPLDIASTYAPSIDLGGDIWGIAPLHGGRLRIYSADFTGHGVGASLNTFRLHTFIASGAAKAEDPAAWLAEINEFLCSTLEVGQFATVFAAVIDFAVGEIAYSLAACPPPLLRSGAGAPFRLLSGAGYPVGITRAADYDTVRVPFPPGSMLVMYSDALIETPDPPDAVLSPERLRDLLAETPSAAAALEMMLAPLRQPHLPPPTDDLTVVALSHREATP
ncbi:MAG: SpoIIE family protein phosphatase [Ancalomicrobiaceae bacterium]|nr:SpoIIE family protein phosphatase [Ancalomicrobiaceae bacterium]